MKTNLEGRKVLVTGGASGIGAATVRAFLTEGANVVAADLDEKMLAKLAADVQGANGRFGAVTTDLSTPGGCETAVSGAVDIMGGLDILVNNVGVGQVRTFEQL